MPKRIRRAALAIVLLSLTAVVTACGGSSSQPTATAVPEDTATVAPTAAPTATAPEATEPVVTDAWSTIQGSGRMVVGTSADNPPFEFYDASFAIDGFDIALMRAIGEKLGVQVEINDFAFDGLPDALQLGQVDAAIAALTVTEQRAQAVDFSTAYYVSSEAILAASDFPLDVVDANTNLSSYQIGVQHVSVYEDWVQANLVDTGKLPAENLHPFADLEQAITALRNGRVDLVLMDLLPSAEFVREGGIKVVGEGVSRQQYAIAVPKGSTLLPHINQALAELQEGGTIAALAKQYLQLDEDEIQPLPTPGPTPTAAAAVPAPPQATAPCLDGMAYVADITMDDTNGVPSVAPGEAFVKTWRVRNVGTCPWTSAYGLFYVDGNSPQAQMGGQPVAVQGTVAPGETYDSSVNLVAPLQAGVYRGIWQMLDAQGTPFGEKVWVTISVPGVVPPTAVPPSDTIQFSVDRSSITAGECVTFQWSAQNVASVYFFAAGQDYTSGGVAGQASQQVCPAATTTYSLRVEGRDGTVQTRQIQVVVNPAENAPVITRFTVDPAAIYAGQCVSVQWAVQGPANFVRMLRNGALLWDGAPISGSQADCPPGTGMMTYQLDAVGATTTSAQDTVNVTAAATPVPTPPGPPTPVPPYIAAFSVTPGQIQVGQCVNISWNVSGGAQRIQILKNGGVVLDGAPFGGSQVDCPTAAGSYTYSVVATNSAGQSDRRDSGVTVGGQPQPPSAPTINEFSVQPTQVSAGQCVDMRWSVSGDVSSVSLYQNDQVLFGNVGNSGSQSVCPSGTGNVKLSVVATGSSGATARQDQTVSVR